MARPALVVVADDTLLTEPVAQPLADCLQSGTVLINCTRNEELIQHIQAQIDRYWATAV